MNSVPVCSMQPANVEPRQDWRPNTAGKATTDEIRKLILGFSSPFSHGTTLFSVCCLLAVSTHIKQEQALSVWARLQAKPSCLDASCRSYLPTQGPSSARSAMRLQGPQRGWHPTSKHRSGTWQSSELPTAASALGLGFWARDISKCSGQSVRLHGALDHLASSGNIRGQNTLLRSLLGIAAGD